MHSLNIRRVSKKNERAESNGDRTMKCRIDTSYEYGYVAYPLVPSQRTSPKERYETAESVTDDVVELEGKASGLLVNCPTDIFRLVGPPLHVLAATRYKAKSLGALEGPNLQHRTSLS